MTLPTLILRSATYHWRTNVAVTLGVAAAVAVLAGALVVGDSVRGSLRDIALGRLGQTDQVLSSMGFFREELSNDVRTALGASATAPLIVADAFVTLESSGRRASKVVVYGVDERFWKFHGLTPVDGVMISPALASEVGGKEGDVLLTRLQKPSEVPIESLFGRKEDIGRTVRLTLAGVLPRDRLGEFSVKPQQADVRAVFAPLRRLQRDLAVPGQVNTILVSGGERTDAKLRSALQLEDLGVRVTVMDLSPPTVVLEGASGIVSEALEAAGRRAASAVGREPTPVFTYLANTIRRGDRHIPYSLITAMDLGQLSSLERNPPAAPTAAARDDTILLNEWAARQLAAAPGDRIVVDYYLWDPAIGLATRSAEFTLAGIVPIVGLAADRRLAPDYPGITGSASLADWDPPFPIDLSRVRPEDERYWDEYRATPKAFIPYERGRELWQSRYGALTSLRLPIYDGGSPAAVASRLRDELRTTLSPNAMGVALYPARAAALEAAQGATDFGQYFTYFSFFLMVSALMLAVLFFKLGVEQRLRQVGILRASGYSMSIVRRLLDRRGPHPRRGRRRARNRRRRPLRQGNRARPRHVVDRRGRDDAAGTACEAAVAGGGSDWWLCGRHVVRPGVASRRRPALAACAVDGSVARRATSAGRSRCSPQPAALDVFHHRWIRADGSGLREPAGSGGSVLRSGSGAARRRAALAGRLAACARHEAHHWARRLGRRAARVPQRRVPSGAQRAVGRPHRVGGLHHRFGRRLQARGRRADVRSEVGNGRLRALRGVRAAAAAQSQPQRAGRQGSAHHSGAGAHAGAFHALPCPRRAKTSAA